MKGRSEMGGNPLRQTQGKRDTRGTEGSEEEMRTEAEVEEGPREPALGLSPGKRQGVFHGAESTSDVLGLTDSFHTPDRALE